MPRSLSKRLLKSTKNALKIPSIWCVVVEVAITMDEYIKSSACLSGFLKCSGPDLCRVSFTCVWQGAGNLQFVAVIPTADQTLPLYMRGVWFKFSVTC